MLYCVPLPSEWDAIQMTMLKGETMKPLRVLSLFDGISCGLQALKECGIPVEVYYASEIEPNAIKCALGNHPEIIQIGDVMQIDFAQYIGKIDIIIGGSPCQGFSVCGKQLAFLDERSALIKYFFDAVEIIKPRWFFLENVVMQKQYEHNIDEVLGVKALRINSALVSYQQRIRLYWTNIKGITQPEQIPNLCIEDMFQYDVSKPSFPEGEFHLDKEPLTEKINRCYAYAHTGPKKNQSTRLYDIRGKHPTLTLNNKNRFLLGGEYCNLNINGYELLQGLPFDYTKFADLGGGRVREPLIGNCWNVPTVKHIFGFLKKELEEDAN